MRVLFSALALASTVAAVTSVAVGAPQSREENALQQAIAAPGRSPENVARDRFRHPAATLRFFGVEPDDTVVEIWPGGGWYTEILAPYLRARGTLWEAAPMPDGLKAIRRMQAETPEVYGTIRTAAFPATSGQSGVPDGSADVVLTFRNAHNWQMAGPETAQAAFDQMYSMLKPGGTLGVVDHRLGEDQTGIAEGDSGYMKAGTIIAYAEKAGFKLADRSDVNANPKDTHDHPKGVWTLPPTYSLGDTDRAQYAAIGESDRMTLRFVKPE
ncbi:class I SAM-dependent methyltransferase [Stakelama saccharophila]|uniref:Methyltransferase domain-containing protein n=1 Tax=Stakelama saccharophila TaxID=3075605 RepID=A0ABZ0B7G4_9SPHN|nr:methyltransferase domain-containing protein [Stakelama sp. W311]WNO53361.1 methyltransferase domain-containing protein [Stakelama sp. W311]